MDDDREDSQETPLASPAGALAQAPQRSVLLHILYMVAGMGVARACGMVSTFLVANILGPGPLGIFSTIRLIYSYGTINHLGVLEAYRKEVPRLRGAGDETSAQEVENLSLWMAWVSSWIFVLIGASVLLTWRYFDPSSQIAKYALPSFFLFVTVAGATVGTLHFDRFTIRHLFEQAGLIRGYRGVAYLIFLPLGAKLGGVTGVCLGFMLAEWSITVVSAWLAHGLCPPMHPFLDVRRLAQLITIGFPITLVWWTYMMGTTFDRIVTVSLLGSEATGLYFLGITMSSVLQMVPEALSRVFNPRINEKMGATSDPVLVAKVVWEPATTLAWILPLAFPLCVFFVEPLYRTGFTKFLPAVLSSQILVVGAVLLAFLPLGTDFLVSIHRQGRLALVVVLSLILNVITNVICIKLGNGIASVAMVSVFTNGLVVCYPWGKISQLVAPGHGLLTFFQLGTGFLMGNLLVWPLECGWFFSLPGGWGGGCLKATLYVAGYSAVMGVLPWSHAWMSRDLARIAMELRKWRNRNRSTSND